MAPPRLRTVKRQMGGYAMVGENDPKANPSTYLPSYGELDKWGSEHEPATDPPNPWDRLPSPEELLGRATEPEAVNSTRQPADDAGSPGYCACCREFHLLTRVQIPALHWYADVCLYCAALGDRELAWRLGGLTEDGKFGYELPADPLRARQTPPPKRWRRNRRLAESLIMDETREDKAAGFDPLRMTPLRRLRVAWWRLRGWQD